MDTFEEIRALFTRLEIEIVKAAANGDDLPVKVNEVIAYANNEGIKFSKLLSTIEALTKGREIQDTFNGIVEEHRLLLKNENRNKVDTKDKGRIPDSGDDKGSAETEESTV